MRVFISLVALVAALLSMALLGIAQLILAASETSYFLHLILGLVLVSGLAVIAGRASRSMLAVAIAGTALLFSLMPLESALVSLEPLVRSGAPESGDLILEASDSWNYMSGLVSIFLIHACLLAVFAVSVRSRVDKPEGYLTKH